MSEAFHMFDANFFDASRLGSAAAHAPLRRTKAMPGTLLPRFVRVGGFWVPDEWRVRADAVDAMKKCPTRRRILRDAPPIDYESLLELGEFVLHDPDQAQDRHVRVAGTDFVYAPELRIQRDDVGGAVVLLEVPEALVLVPRRVPAPPGVEADVRDAVEVVCVFSHEGTFHAAPLAACWRFALAWGPNPPTPQRVLRALAERDTAALQPSNFFVAPDGETHVRRLHVDTLFGVPPTQAPEFMTAVYALARAGYICVLGANGMADAPTPVVRMYPGSRLGWLAEVVFDYAGFIVPPYDAPPSHDANDRERFVVREFATEEQALQRLADHFGEPDEACHLWALSKRRVATVREFLAELRDVHGWRIEIAEDTPGGRRPKRRTTGLASEPIFRSMADQALDAAGELAYQRYAAFTRSLDAAEADEIAAEIAASAGTQAALPGSPDAAVEPEVPPAPDPHAAAAFHRSMERWLASIAVSHIRQLGVKVAEIRRLQRVHAQRPGDIEATIAEAEPLVTRRGFRLLAHQRDALRGLLHRLRIGTGAILALPVGYGKTLVALLVAVTLKRLGVVEEPVLWIGTKSTLVSLRGDLRRFMPELRVCDYTGGRRVADFAAADLVMTNYNLARGETGVDFETGGPVGALVEATWGLLVLDEFSVVANPGTSSFQSVAAIRAQAKRVLLLNATMLENTTVDLWAHLELVSPGTYGTADLFAGFDRMLLSEGDAFEAASDRVRRDVFAYTVDEKQCSAADLSIPPLIWRPPHHVPLEPLHAERMTAFHISAARYAKRFRTGRRAGGAVTRMRRGCHSVRFLDPEFSAVGDAPRAEIVAEWVAAEFVAGHHCIVFSQWVDTLELIAERLSARGLSSDMLIGPTDSQRRTELARKWGNAAAPPSDTAALLIQPQAGGRGLNLVGADRIIFAEPFWNPGLVYQCVGRAHRMGQIRPVSAVMVTSDAAIEQLILRRAGAKQRLAEAIFGGDRLPTADALAAWVEHHELLADADAPERSEDERVAAVRAVVTMLDELAVTAAKRMSEIAAAGHPPDVRARLVEDLEVELFVRTPGVHRALTSVGRQLAVNGDELDVIAAGVAAVLRMR